MKWTVRLVGPSWFIIWLTKVCGERYCSWGVIYVYIYIHAIYKLTNL